MTRKRTYQELEGSLIALNKKTLASMPAADKALRESEEKYRSLVESCGDSIYLVDRHLRYLFMNQGHLSRFGLPMDKIEGRRYGEFHSQKETKIFRAKAKKCSTLVRH